MGYGDYLMLSGKLKMLDQTFNHKVQICFPDLEGRLFFKTIFKNNPRYTPMQLLDRNKPSISLPQYFVRNPRSLKWITDQTAISGEIYFDEQELENFEKKFKQKKPFVIIQPFFSKGKIINNKYVEYPHYVNRNISIELVNYITQKNRSRIDFIFLNHKELEYETELSEIKNIKIIEVEDFRESILFMKKSKGYFGIEGGLHHVAGALGKNAIVVFGHWINPKLTGYALHKNIFSNLTDYGCASMEPCSECINFNKNISAALIADLFETEFLG